MTQVYNDLFSAVTHMGLDPTGAWSLLQAGVDAGTLLPTTDGKLAVSKIKTATGWAFPASVDVYNLIQKEKTSAKPVKGHIKVAKTNIVAAIKDWEACLRYDPQNAKASARLKEAKVVQERLDKPPPKK